MVDPEVIHRVAGAALLGGVMVLFGAGYAIFHALAGLTGSRRMVGVSLLCYALLCGCAVAFSALLKLAGWWLALMGLLLIGYFIAPRFIWRLSLALHGESAQSPASDRADPSAEPSLIETEVSRHE
ncbi:MAG: hypothetical protein OXS50_01450 [Gammaproteobacteria bacterium]|nr:hypothetical protein [Gammaproteobacteria bacterium]